MKQAAETINESNPILNEGVVSLDQAMTFLGVKLTTLYRLMDQGRLPWVKVVGRRKIPRVALRRLLAENFHGEP